MMTRKVMSTPMRVFMRGRPWGGGQTALAQGQESERRAVYCFWPAIPPADVSDRMSVIGLMTDHQSPTTEPWTRRPGWVLIPYSMLGGRSPAPAREKRMRTTTSALITALALAAGGWSDASAELLKVSVPQRGQWDTAVTELGLRGGVFKKYGLDIDVLYTQGGP